MQIDQYWIFFIISLIATGLVLILSYLSYNRRSSPGASTFSRLMLLVALWTFSISMGMLSSTPSEAFIWAVLRMVGVFFVPVLWLGFAFQFADRETTVDVRLLSLTSVLPVLFTILMVTSQTNSLFLVDIQYIRSGPFLIDVHWELGPLFYVHIIYCYILVLGGILIILREALQLSKAYRGQSIALITGVFMPLLTNISYAFHLIPQLKVNYDPFGFVLAGIVFALALFRQRIFDILPVARRMLIDSMDDGLIVVDRQGRIIDLNPAAAKLLPEYLKSPIGESLSTHLPEVNKRAPTDHQANSTFEFSLSHEGANHYYDVRMSLIDNNLPDGSRFYVFRDITKRKQLETELKYLSITDPLTGVFNLRHFLDLARAEVSKTQRHTEPFSIVLTDIDHFKRVNDQYGHLVGDQVLQSIALFYLQNIRIEDIFARYGGEEFILGLPKTSKEEAFLLAERLCQGIESAVHQTDGGPIQVTFSMGVATMDGSSNLALRRLIDRADQALYDAKAHGRNSVRIWTEDLKNLEH